MKGLFTGGFGFLLCLLIGILADQVALGIVAGLLVGAFFGAQSAKTPDDKQDV
jgi:hypothetical protein